MKKWIQRYTGFLRNLRVVHYVYNVIHRKGLLHNEHLYPYYELDKSIYASLSSNDFRNKKAKAPWLDGVVTSSDIEEHPVFAYFPEDIGKQLLEWPKNGYLVWKNFASTEVIDAINEDIDRLLEKEEVGFNYTGKKIFNAYRSSYAVRSLIKDKRLLRLLSFILDRKVFPFQTINFLQSSEQAPHSDSIHMSTFPQGNLIAAWIALEDIGEQQGPVCYYPGSQQLPYITNEDYGNTATTLAVDGQANAKYERKVESLLQEHPLQKKVFTAAKGDLLVWHGNLLHGGEPMLQKGLTRKSLVAHYFAEGVICYHEISERPAIFDTELVGEVQDDFYKGEESVFSIR